MLKIVHVIEHFGNGGPERAILAAAKYSARAGLQQQRTVCTLEAAVSPLALVMARQVGVHVVKGSDSATMRACLQDADIVQVHYWNNPAMQRFLRADWPACRLLLFTDIFGDHAPHVITPSLLGYADAVVVASAGTLQLPAVRAWLAQPAGQAQPVEYILAPADFDRLRTFAPRPHPGINVGYIGAVDFAKLHPAFVAMSAAVRRPDVRFIVCGMGGERVLGAQVAAEGDRFQLRGYVENIAAALGEFDLFGYPLRPETYAASELVLQEAMWVGVPPVVFPYGGVGCLVEDGVTGRVVHSPAEYSAAIEELCAAPAERRRLGENARDFARAQFDPMSAVGKFAAIYDMLMQQPKRPHRWPDEGDTPAAWFVAALGHQGDAFARSLRGPDRAAEATIAAASDLLFSGEGGLAHYCNAFPDDPQLRLWVDLVLRQRGPRT